MFYGYSAFYPMLVLHFEVGTISKKEACVDYVIVSFVLT